MKRFVSLLMALCLTLCCSAALAAGKLEVTQETYVAVESYGSCTGYLYAEITNTGNSNAEFDSGVLEVLSENGDVTDTSAIYSAYPNVLAPGEKAYLVERIYAEDGVQLSEIADHSLSVLGKTSKDEAAAHLDASAVVEAYEGWDGTDYRIILTVTNSTDKTVYDALLVVGVYDQDGTLLYADDDVIYRVGIPAGGTLEYRLDVNTDIVACWKANSIQPISAEVICYVELEY